MSITIHGASLLSPWSNLIHNCAVQHGTTCMLNWVRASVMLYFNSHLGTTWNSKLNTYMWTRKPLKQPHNQRIHFLTEAIYFSLHDHDAWDTCSLMVVTYHMVGIHVLSWLWHITWLGYMFSHGCDISHGCDTCSLMVVTYHMFGIHVLSWLWHITWLGYMFSHGCDISHGCDTCSLMVVTYHMFGIHVLSWLWHITWLGYMFSHGCDISHGWDTCSHMVVTYHMFGIQVLTWLWHIFSLFVWDLSNDKQ